MQGFVQAGQHGFFCQSQPVIGNADVADHALGLGFHHGFIQAGVISRLGAEGGIVELVNVNIVGLQGFQAGVEILPEILCLQGGGFGGDHNIFPHVVEGITDFGFAVRIGTGSIKVIDAMVVGFAEQLGCFLHGNTLNRQGAETVFAHGEIGFSQANGIHSGTSLKSYHAVTV